VVDSAYPILKELGIPATVFVVAGAIGETNEWDQQVGDCVEDILTADELRELDAVGFEIASHTMTHAHLIDLMDEGLKAEIYDSKRVLEDILQKPVPGFSYPYGEWDSRVRDTVIQAGYEYSVGTMKGVIRIPLDRFAVPRINVRWNNTASRIVHKARRALGK
jgi:peptidoglycan/xylan/chitin deacetylase (PgdA/CDA1 family)